MQRRVPKQVLSSALRPYRFECWDGFPQARGLNIVVGRTKREGAGLVFGAEVLVMAA